MKRRDFLTLAAGAAVFPSLAVDEEKKTGTMEFHLFSRSFKKMDYDSLCETAAKAGLDGIEWTVRGGGHVLPARVKTDLPLAVAAAKKRGLKAEMIATGISGPDSANAEAVLKTARDCGITHFRTNYFCYDEKTSMKENLERIRRGFAALEKLCRATGMVASYQNHSSVSRLFGGVVWDIWAMIQNLDPRWVTVQYDPMHAFIESGSNWTHGLELVAERISSVCLKDFYWAPAKGNPEKLRTKVNCAGGEGIVPWATFAKLTRKLEIHVPMTLHLEYTQDPADPFKEIKHELDFFKKALAPA